MKNILSLLITLFVFKNTLADNFIVNSNADSGPGTLRQAITDAALNGTSVSDVIQFYLPDQSASGRQIILYSSLPELSSNLTIDGTTQPGMRFGLSDAQVEIVLDWLSNVMERLFTIRNCSGIRVYGLKLVSKVLSPPLGTIDVTAFYIRNSSDIEIGNIGKGNLVQRFNHVIRMEHDPGIATENNSDVRIYSNLFGLHENGLSAEDNYNLIYASRIENIEVGGVDPKQGNVMTTKGKRIQLFQTKGKILIANNKVGTDVTGTAYLGMGYGDLRYLDDIEIFKEDYAIKKDTVTEIRILDNLLAGQGNSGIHIKGYAKGISIQGNRIGTDITGTKSISNLDYGILLEYCDNAIIGVEKNEAKEKNIIAFASRFPAGTGVAVFNCSKGITISRNSIFCNLVKGISLVGDPEPIISINSIVGGTIAGTCPPNSRIEVFKDDECPGCQGKIFLEAFNADATGRWSYNHPDPSSLVFTATDQNGMTTEFSSGIIEPKKSFIRPETCGGKNGGIEGIQIVSGTWWQWEDEYGNVVGRDTNLTNVKAGRYKLVAAVLEGVCKTETNWFHVGSVTVPANVSVNISNASCGLANGMLTTGADPGLYKLTWLSVAGDSIASGPILNRAMPGVYSLKLSLAQDTLCYRIFGPYSINNMSGPTLDLNNVRVKNAACGLSNGAITGITATNYSGVPFMQWQDSTGRTVGSNFELNNVAPGKYRFLFKDISGCDTIRTNFFVIPPEGVITIDTSARIIEHATCRNNSGTIRNIKVTGGTDFTWTDPSGAVVAKSVDVFGLPAGSYKLHVGNTTGCSLPAPRPFVIQQLGFDHVDVNSIESRHAICGQNTGSIKVASLTKDSMLYRFQWKDSMSGQLLAPYLVVDGLGAGTYQLFATDTNGCTAKIYSKLINSIPRPTIDADQIKITHDQCNQKLGSLVLGSVSGLTGPTSYVWTDAANNLVGNALDLKNISSGTYKLTLTDAGFCVVESPPVSVLNTNLVTEPPVYNTLQVPRYSAAVLKPVFPGSGTYSLFTSSNGSSLLQNSTGEFIIPNVTNDTAFYIQRAIGSCGSSMVRVEIKVVDRSYFAIPNAFTPNGDGKNDKLNLRIIGHIEVGYFRIFNRFGEMVFQTHQVNSGWDGRVNGVIQNSGTYVWMAEGKDLQGNSIRSKGTITLIR